MFIGGFPVRSQIWILLAVHLEQAVPSNKSKLDIYKILIYKFLLPTAFEPVTIYNDFNST